MHVPRHQLWLSQARVPDADKASLLNVFISPGYTFGPAMEAMLQWSHRATESSKHVPLIPRARGNSDGNPDHCAHCSSGCSTWARLTVSLQPTLVGGGQCLAATPAAPSTEAAPAERSPADSARATVTLTGSGHSQHHLLAWRQCTADAWVLANVHSGYSLQFHTGVSSL
ncbi:UNVERIFIED_CONTAM: hypothetical protein FKN15_018856 [Acipenser sinensis]